jgi:hypothetical protein
MGRGEKIEPHTSTLRSPPPCTGVGGSVIYDLLLEEQALAGLKAVLEVSLAAERSRANKARIRTELDEVNVLLLGTKSELDPLLLDRADVRAFGGAAGVHRIEARGHEDDAKRLRLEATEATARGARALEAEARLADAAALDARAEAAPFEKLVGVRKAFGTEAQLARAEAAELHCRGGGGGGRPGGPPDAEQRGGGGGQGGRAEVQGGRGAGHGRRGGGVVSVRKAFGTEAQLAHAEAAKLIAEAEEVAGALGAARRGAARRRRRPRRAS